MNVVFSFSAGSRLVFVALPAEKTNSEIIASNWESIEPSFTSIVSLKQNELATRAFHLHTIYIITIWNR